MRRASLLVLALLLPATAHPAVTGRVIDPEGKPLGGVRVRSFAREAPDMVAARLTSAKPERIALASAETKADGTFSIDAKNAGVVDLLFEADERESVMVEAVDGEDAGAFALRPAKKIRGRVTAGGKGVPNAFVALAATVATRTGEDGAYELNPLSAVPRGSMVAVVHPDYVPVMETSRDRKSPYEVELRPGIAIAGRVLGPDGTTPVAGATVRASTWPLAKSGDDGTFRIAHAPPSVDVLIAIEGMRIGRVTFDKRKASHDVVLRPGATLSGSVKSTKDDAPVAGAVVAISGQSMSTLPISTFTDARGNYAIAPLLPSNDMVFLQHPAFLFTDTSAVDVAAGARVTRNFTATPLGRIRGLVVDEQRKPVAAAQASFGRGTQAMATTGPDGTFVVRAQRSSQPMTVVVSKSGYATASEGPLAVAPGETKNVTVTLRRGFRFEVQVVDKDGAPIAREPVSLSRWIDDSDAQSRVQVACSENDPATCNVTDESGRRTYDITDGKYDVVAGGRTTPMRTIARQVLDASSKPLVIELERGAPIEGRVLGADDQPVEGVFVRSSRGGAMSPTDATGAFTIGNLPAGTSIPLTAETRSGLQSETVTVTAPASNVVLRLPRPARIEGRVFDRETKQPVREFSIVVARQRRGFAPQTPRRFAADDGRFVIEDATPEEVELSVQAKGYAPGSMSDLRLTAGATANVEIALDRGAAVTGRVTSGGRPLADVTVFVAATGPRAGRMTDVRTDAAGEFTLDGVAPGARRIEFRKTGFVAKASTIDVVAGRENRADVELARGRELTGRVIDSSGRGVPLAEIAIRNAPGAQSPRTDAEGAFKIEGLGEQTYLVMARKDGYLNAEVEVNPAEQSNITLTLGRGGSLSGRVVGVPEAELSSVEVTAFADRWRTTTRPDASGNFTLQGVPDGRVDVRATQQQPVRRQAEPKAVEVANGTGPFVQLDFTSGIAVRGRVTRDGKPVEGGITFTPNVTPRERHVAPIWSALDANGEYEVRISEPGEYLVRVDLFAQRLALAPSQVNVTGPMTHDIEIRGATLRGRVTDEKAGTPIAGAQVQLQSPGKPMSSATSDSDGRFSFDAVSDDTYRITAQREQFVSDPIDVVVSGGSAQEIEIRMRQGMPVGVRVVDALDGRLLDASITPRPATASARAPMPSSHAARGENGAQRLWLLPGSYKADVWVAGYIRRTVDLVVPGPDVHVMLEKGGTVVVQGRVAGAVFLRLRPAGEKRAVATTSVMSGRMEAVPPGTWTLEALDGQQNVLATRAGVTVVAGQTTTVTLD